MYKKKQAIDSVQKREWCEVFSNEGIKIEAHFKLEMRSAKDFSITFQYQDGRGKNPEYLKGCIQVLQNLLLIGEYKINRFFVDARSTKDIPYSLKEIPCCPNLIKEAVFSGYPITITSNSDIDNISGFIMYQRHINNRNSKKTCYGALRTATMDLVLARASNLPFGDILSILSRANIFYSCKHDSKIPIEIITTIPKTQKKTYRHRCSACAYDKGKNFSLSLDNLPSVGCEHGASIPIDILSGLKISQAGETRHKCPVCAFKIGLSHQKVINLRGGAVTDKLLSIIQVEDSMKETNILSSEPVYPLDLLKWSSHKGGGVRRAFENGGRPTGVIVTPLIQRIEKWLQEIYEKKTNIRALILVGGPGNGKTDTVEQAVRFFGKKAGHENELVERFQKQLSKSSPRRLEVEVGDLLEEDALISKILLVQDASVSHEDKTPELALLEEIMRCAKDEKLLYICCLNRGVLADSLKSAKTDLEVDLLTQMSQVVAQGRKPQQCWPLIDQDWIAIWPMDSESLLEDKGSEPSVGYQLFYQTLQDKYWTECQKCSYVDRCPFSTNQKTLKDNKNLEFLLSILRRHEIFSGKHWTFRDLLSLVPELLVGNEVDFKNKSPCDWVKDELKLIDSSNKGDLVNGWKATFRLSRHLYQQNLFPSWPLLRSSIKSMRAANKASQDQKSDIGKTLLNWLSNDRLDANTEVRRILSSSLGKALDPVHADLDLEITEKIKVRTIDMAFSQSINEGIKRINYLKISKLDRTFLKLLAEGETALNDLEVKNYRDGELSKKLLRHFACRYIKRSILVKKGLTKDHELFQDYQSLSNNEVKLRKFKNEFTDLLNRKGNLYSSSLVQTLGQPYRGNEKDVVLVSTKIRANSITTGKLYKESNTPSTNPFIDIKITTKKTQSIVLTFSLYKALVLSCKNIYKGCISPEIISLIQNIETRINGLRVRDKEVFYDGDGKIDFLNGRFVVDVLGEEDFNTTWGEGFE